MNNELSLKLIFTEKVKDYTFTILFFLVFSVFIIFAISPSLRTAFSLKKQEQDLNKVHNIYEQKIINIVDIQNQIEENRDNLFLINQAISQYPEVNKMVDDVKTIADKNSFLIAKANISDINLKQTTKQVDKVRLNIEGKTTFDNLTNFINDLFAQRRLKMISNLKISKDKDSTDSGQLKVFLIIDGFYL